MKFSIITPSLNMLPWLRKAIASVSDQDGVQIEHIIQDGGSTDGTIEALRSKRSISFVSEPDNSMYDAVNKGWRKAAGDIIGHLNCDEQYLLGSLKKVADYFDAHPKVVVLFAAVLIVNPVGELICYQKVIRPTQAQIMVSHLPIYTCATFFRRSLLDEHRLYYCVKYRTLADAYWVLEILRRRIPFRVWNEYVSVYTDRADNLNLTPSAKTEARQLASSAPRWLRWFRPVVVARHRVCKLWRGCYWSGPLLYNIYTGEDDNMRVAFREKRPSPLWRKMLRIKSSDYYVR